MINVFLSIASFLNSIFFFEIFGFPLLVIWLFSAGIFLSFKLCFPNVRFFRHGLDIALHNKYYSPSDIGEITPRQALFTSISGTVGMGNIAGVAIAIKLGGPGAVIWMMITAFFSMNTVFTEATLSQTYREVDANGKTNGGPFRYLRKGLEGIGFPKLGIGLSLLYTFTLILGSLGCSMFQVNQAVNMITDYKIFSNYKIIFGIIFGLFALYVLCNGAKSVGKIIEKIVPAMAILYLLCAITILCFNYKNIPSSFLLMFKDAFGIESVVSGFIGTLVIGIRRAGFSNEAGLGTTSIAHAVAKTKEPVREGAIACMTPMVDTMFFCCLTALMIISTGAYTSDLNGVLMTKKAFESVAGWFPILLSIAVVLFALSNVITYSFYGQSAFKNLLKNRMTYIFNCIFVLSIFTSSFADVDSIVQIADAFVLSLSIPNLIGVYMLSGVIKQKIISYKTRWKNGEFDK